MTEKIIKIGVGLSFLLPLVFTSWTMYPAHFGKTIFFQMLIAVLGLIGLGWIALKKKTLFRFKALDWVVLAFFGSMLVSAIFGNNFNRSFWGDQSRVQGVFTWIHFIVFYFLIRQFFAVREDWKKILGAVLGISILSSITAWAGPHIPFIAQYIEAGPRLAGLIGNPIFFANYLMLPMFLGIFYYFYFSENAWKYLGATAAVLSLITIMGTRTRGAFVGLVFGFGLSFFLYLIFGKSKKIRISLAAAAILAAAVLGSGFVFSGVKKAMPSQVSFIYSISLNDTTAKTRLMAWQIALKGFRGAPIIGNGPESYQYIFDKYYNPKFLEFSFSETVWDQPHNFVLEIMSAMGLLGLAAYLSLIGIIFFQLIKKIKGGENSNASLAAIFLAGGVGAYVVQLLFSFETSNSLQVWFLALPLVGWLALKENREEVPVRDRYLNPAIIIYLVFLIVSFTMGVRMLKASYYTSLARDARFIDSKYLWEKNADLAISAPVPFRWEQAINLTMDLANMDGGGKLDQETFDAVAPKLETAYLDAIKKYPDTYIYKFWLGQLYSFMGEYINRDYYPKAEAVLLDAGKINEDRQQIPLLLGKLYFLWGDDKKSEEVLGKLAEKNPDYPEPHWFYGLALMKNNKTKEGIAELEKGLSYAQTSKGNLSYIIDIYAREKMFEKIVPIYERMIAGNPGDASNYARLSATYMAMGNKEKAVEYMQKAVEINPALQEEAIKFLKDNGVTVK